MRTFLAVELPQPVKGRLSQLQQELDRRLPARAIRWSGPSHIHLTLRFLGETSLEQCRGIASSLAPWLVNVEPFNLSVGGLGCFPNWRRPKVLWVAVSGQMAALQHVQSEVERVARCVGFEPEDKTFFPHITLGRMHRRNSNWEQAQIGALLQEYVTATMTDLVQLGSLQVAALMHLRSELQPTGPVYTLIDQFNLGKNSR